KGFAFRGDAYYGQASNGCSNYKTMTRPSDHTREAIIKAAVHLFAEKGFDGTSVRDIVTKARVNQAAINYHFKSKDGLYLEVLKTAFERLTTDAGFDPEKLKSLSREQAVRSGGQFFDGVGGLACQSGNRTQVQRSLRFPKYCTFFIC